MIISFDTETTGLDLNHGAKPFLVTTCDEQGRQLYWEWFVNPKTREPEIPKGDLEEICAYLDKADEIVGHNIKFDVHAMRTILPNYKWNWAKTRCTLIAAHMLGSNHEKNLTDLAMRYKDYDIQPYEDKMEVAVNECVKICKKSFGDWMIAAKGLACMPSAKNKVWKFDTWLPRAIAKRNGYKPEHHYWRLTKDYANMDSSMTLSIWFVMRSLLQQRKLWESTKSV